MSKVSLEWLHLLTPMDWSIYKLPIEKIKPDKTITRFFLVLINVLIKALATTGKTDEYYLFTSLIINLRWIPIFALSSYTGKTPYIFLQFSGSPVRGSGRQISPSFHISGKSQFKFW
jgi:hypothetical protein